MSQTFASTAHLLGGAGPTAAPVTLVIWVTSSGGQFRRFLSLANSGDNANYLFVGTDPSGSATNKVDAGVGITGNVNNALSTVAIDTTGNWNHCAAVFASSSSRSSYLNGANKGTSSASGFTPTGINEVLISGRASDFTSGIAGQAAHAAIWSRALTDNEIAYLGAGGHPRAIKGLTSYWKIASGASPVPDEVGTNDLTVTSTTAGTTNPSLETFFTGTAIPTQNYTVGSAITAINLAAGAGLVDDVSSAYTASLCQLGTTSQPATTSSALTATRELVLSTTTGIAKNDFIKVTSGGTPTRVLGVDATNSKIVVDADQTYSSGAQIYRFPVNPLSVSGLSISSNSFGGTPTVAATNTLCLFKFTCNADNTRVAFSNPFTMNITGGGGGGGASIGALTAAFFNGGFQGG